MICPPFLKWRSIGNAHHSGAQAHRYLNIWAVVSLVFVRWDVFFSESPLRAITN